MKNKYGFVAGLLLGVALCAALFTMAYRNSQKPEGEDKITVVTSFYPIYIAAANVVGDIENMEVINLSEPQTGCLHDFQMTPEDMKLVSGADIFLVNGCGMESFLEDVFKQYPLLEIIKTAEEIPFGDTLTLSGDSGMDEENAHVWMSVKLYRQQVAVIAEKLCELAEENASELEANAAAYDKKLEELETQQDEIRNYAAGSRIISFHEAYEYIAADYGLTVGCFLNLDEERQVSAGEVADVLKAVEEDGITMIFAEELYGSGLAETISKEAKVQVFYLDTLVRGDYALDSYLDGMQANIDTLRDAFGVE